MKRSCVASMNVFDCSAMHSEVQSVTSLFDLT